MILVFETLVMKTQSKSARLTKKHLKRRLSRKKNRKLRKTNNVPISTVGLQDEESPVNKLIHELRDQIFGHLSIRDLIQLSQTSTFMEKLVYSYFEFTNQTLSASLWSGDNQITINSVILYNVKFVLRYVKHIMCHNSDSLKVLRKTFNLLKNIEKIEFNFHLFWNETYFMKKVIFSNLTSLSFFKCKINFPIIRFLLNHKQQINSLELVWCEFNEIRDFPSSDLFTNLEIFKCQLKAIPYNENDHVFFANFILTSSSLQKVILNSNLLEDINFQILSPLNSNHKINNLTSFQKISFSDLKPKMFEKFENINEIG